MLVSTESQAPMSLGIYLYMQSIAGRGPALLWACWPCSSWAWARISHRFVGARAPRSLLLPRPDHEPSLPECRHISLSYGATPVLRDVNLKIEPGEFSRCSALGPGKSTLLRLIAGFNQHQSGELLIDGQDISGVPPHLRGVGMVFQNYALWPHMTVGTTWPSAWWSGASRDAIRHKGGQAALELVGLQDYGQRRPGQLSGGQQQRVALARTVVIEPSLLLLDEPLSNLDKKLRVQMREELKNLQRQLGLTTIFVTHDQEEAMTTADRMAVLDQGVLQQVGTAAGCMTRRRTALWPALSAPRICWRAR